MEKVQNRFKERIIIPPATREIKDVLEQKIEELSRHLAEEKQVSRREKIHVARLHRELARYKGDKEVKEKDTLRKDLERERMLRADAEKKLKELTIESDQSQSRFHQLQTEFQKMEQAVSQMMQFKSKIDQLKQEKSSLSMQYENNLQKYNSHISSLERENIMLLNDVKKFEQQMSNGTDQERTKLLLERLKVLEAENSSLVLENEQQRQQYEKCLDEIANQVVQALLAQKALREECVKLQTRVQDLELQNKELTCLFQQKLKYSSSTVLQSLPCSQAASSNTLCEGTSYYNSVCSLPTTSAVSIETMHLSSISQNIIQSSVTQQFHVLSTSTESLHSLDAKHMNEESRSQSCHRGNKVTCGSPNCAEKCDGIQCTIETEFPATNSSPKMKHVSLAERASEKAKQRSASTSSLNAGTKIRTFRTNSTASLGKSKIVPPGVISNSSTNISTNQVEVAVQVHQSDSSAKKRSLSQPEHINKSTVNMNCTGNQSKTVSKTTKTELSKSTSKLNPKVQKLTSSSCIPTKKSSKSQSSLPQPSGSQSRISQKKYEQDSGRKNSGCTGQVNSNLQVPKNGPNSLSQESSVPKFNQTSTQCSTDNKQREITQPSRLSSLPNGQYFYDYSDEDSDINRPISGFSNGSTVSINEILDDDDDTDTLLDADFTAEKFAFFETPQFMKQDKKKKEKSKQSKEKPVFSSLRGKPDIVKDTEYSEHKNKIKSPRSHRRRSSLPHSLKSKPNRPSSLVLSSKDKQSIQHAYSSSSLESSDSDENWSPQFARQYQLKLYHARNKSGSSESGSMSGSLSDKVQLKSPQELTPTISEKSVFIPAEATDRENNIYREVIVVKNPDNSSSLEKKKGPPPPVPKKPPIAGRRSPGIIMGIQSPGLRNKAFFHGQDAGLLKPHEFKTGVFENIETTVNTVTEIQSHKYMSSDSSFESVKNEKVERSGSKDDGYSTMSSDIQPEMLEKFSDSSLKRDVVLRNDFQVRNDITVMSTESSHKFVSCGTSPMEVSVSSAHSTNLSPKQLSPTIQDKNIGHSSLGRVKAMKHLFEAESQKQTENYKPFPLRKSFSFDSKLGSRENSQRQNINRRSLGDNVKLDISENDFEPGNCNSLPKADNSESLHVNDDKKKSPIDDKQIHVEIDTYTEHNVNIEVTNEQTTHPESSHFISKLDHVTISDSTSRSHVTPERNSIYHMLNHSEENFLSDIPEEKEDYGEMSGASNEKLLDFPVRPQASKIQKISETIHIFETSTTKRYWSSTNGLCRFLSDSDLVKIMKDDLENVGKNCSVKPLERSVSLSALNTKTEIVTNMKLAPTLRRSCRQSLINEISVMGRVQDIVKEHILKQLALSVSSESDDDLQNYSFAQLLAKKQRQNFLVQAFESKYRPHSAVEHVFEPSNDSFSSSFHGNDSSFSSNEEKGDDKGRQSSKESSPMVEKPSKFRSDYYSLCIVGSNRSLFSGSNEGESEQVSMEESHCLTCKEDPTKCRQCIKAKNSKEFDEISRQLQSLSKTVNALQESFTGVESCDSDLESNEDHSHMFVSSNSDFHADGYQWIEDDEFYLTPCGGELIMGASPFSDTGACAEWINEYADDTSCNDEFEFYGNFASESVDVQHLVPCIKEEIHRPQKTNTTASQQSAAFQQSSSVSKVKNSVGSCDSYSKQRALKSLRADNHMRHHSDGHLQINSHDSRAPKDIGVGRETTTEHKLSDPQVRAAMLDSMVHLSGASMDSLDDNIGVDHVMCSRLLGGDKGPVRSNGTRSAVDLSQFFIRYGEREQEAVAAFDFLDEINSNTDFIGQTSQSIFNQSNDSSQATLLHVTNHEPDNMSHSNTFNKKEMQISDTPDTKVQSQDTKDTRKELKNKPVKTEKKFFSFSRSKSSKTPEPVKEKESKLPKKIKTKEIKDKDSIKEKSKIPKFRSASNDRNDQKLVKQNGTKSVQETVKSNSFKSNFHSEQIPFKLNNKVVDKL